MLKRNRFGALSPRPIREMRKPSRISVCLKFAQEHYESAIDYYRQAIAINPNLPGLQMNLGLALFKVAQFPEAIKSFSSEIRKHPGDLRLTILLGMAHYGMKDYLVAIPYLKRATERDPQNVPLRIDVGAQLHAEQAISMRSQCAQGDSRAQCRIPPRPTCSPVKPSIRMGDSARGDEGIASGGPSESPAAERALWARLSPMDREQMDGSGQRIPVGTSE